jgi:hypothetical protein
MKRSALSLLLFTSFSLPPSALAQSAPIPAAKWGAPLTETLSGPAKTDFAAAQVLIHNGDLAGAYVKLGQAYDLSSDPRLLLNMALCARDMHDYARMQTLLVQYEREGKARMPADEKVQVDRALTAIRELVGAVRLTVSEAGATVAVDGETVGTTPLDDRLTLNLAKHKITVSKPGFQPAERFVDVAGGSETPLAITLLTQPETHSAHLIVASEDGATVVIDGQEVARGRFDGPLAAAVHEVRVTELGKVPYKAHVELHDGETRAMDVSLVDETHGGAIWPWIVGGAAVAAGAAVGGYFLFKSPDKQQAGFTGAYATVNFAAFGGQR